MASIAYKLYNHSNSFSDFSFDKESDRYLKKETKL